MPQLLELFTTRKPHVHHYPEFPPGIPEAVVGSKQQTETL